MKRIVLLIACALMVSGTTIAQQMKIGYVNSQELLQAMPEFKSAETQIQTYAKTFQDQLQTMGKDYESKLTDFQAKEKTMTEAMREVKINEIQDLQARIEKFNQSAQQKIEVKREELLKPILDKADKAIKDVAKENGYDYVLDATAGLLLHAKETYNILPLVKQKMNIK